MLSWPSLSEVYAVNVREAHALAARLTDSRASIDDTVARTRETIAASRLLISQVEKQFE